MTEEKKAEQRTRSAFIWTSVLKTPFWTLYGLLGFIIYKDLHANSVQIAAFIALRPIVSVFSIYWSAFVNKRRDRLIPNIIAAGILGHLPFFFFPFVSNPWFFIFAGALYLMLKRGIIPAWMEILKLNIPSSSREKVFSYGSAISYIGGIIFPILIGDLLDVSPGIWRWLYPLMALISLASMFFQLRIPIPASQAVEEEKIAPLHHVLQPWKSAWHIFKTHRDFSQFQVGFFLGGMGLMIMQPALPAFFFDTLKISYAELAVALAAFKGIGFAITTPLWTSWMKKIDIFRFSSLVTIIAAVFPFCLLLAQYQLFWLYLAYISYGIMQAGSELSWHLSGPIFSKKEDSSAFSSLNVAAVGLRGCIAPFIGSLLCSQLSATYALLLGAAFCIFSTLHMRSCSKRLPVPE